MITTLGGGSGAPLAGFVVAMTPAEANVRVNELATSKKGSDNSLANSIDHLERDGIVSLFDDSTCNQATIDPLPSQEITASAWMTAIHAPIKPAGNQFKANVWVVDSGIATEYSSELNVDRANSASCNTSGCTATGTPNDTNDRLGHGTMIAGLIGAQQNSKWFVGVAPGVKLRAVKIFKGKPKIDWVTAYQGIYWVMSKAAQGDVVNISWGGPWDPDPSGNRRSIEILLRAMADRGVRVAIAAGNSDALKGSGYVQTISPARAGAYRPSNSLGGAVVTASAYDPSNNSFWPYSAFGNGTCTTSTCSGPPDFSEPGVDISSLWPGGVQNTCSGTSFSAALLSGLLVQGIPVAGGPVTGDLDAIDPGTQNPIAVDNDIIGICTVGSGSVCHEP